MARCSLPALLVALAALLAAFVAVAGAAPPRALLTVTPSSVHRGGHVQILGWAASCPVGDTVTIMSRAFQSSHAFAGVPAVLTRVRRHELFGTTARIRRRVRPGRYDVTARCGGGNLGVAEHLVVRP